MFNKKYKKRIEELEEMLDSRVKVIDYYGIEVLNCSFRTLYFMTKYLGSEVLKMDTVKMLINPD